MEKRLRKCGASILGQADQKSDDSEAAVAFSTKGLRSGTRSGPTDGEQSTARRRCHYYAERCRFEDNGSIGAGMEGRLVQNIDYLLWVGG
jgi:hypothetical protein